MKRKLLFSLVSLAITMGTFSENYPQLTLSKKQVVEKQQMRFTKAQAIEQKVAGIKPAFAPKDVTFPYTENFETGSTWAITDAANKMSIGALNGLNPISGSSYLISMFNSAASRNAWAISTAVPLTAGKTYYIYVNAYAPGYGGFNDEFTVTAGNTQSSDSQTTILIDKSGTNATSITKWTNMEATFTPETTGDYYFGIHHCTQAFDVNAVAFEDFIVSENQIIPAPVAKAYSVGGLYSATSSDQISYLSENEESYYFADVNNVSEFSWLFDGHATNKTQLKGDTIVKVVYDSPGQHVASLDILGLDGTTLAPVDTIKIQRPQGLSDFVWNVNSSDEMAIYTTGSNYNYAFGLNTSYKKIAELFYLPSNVKTSLKALVFYVYYYKLTSANRSKAFNITIQSVDPTTGAPGTVLGTYAPTFSTVFGSSTISATGTFKQYTLDTPLDITGSYYVVTDFTNAGTPSSSNNLGMISTQERSYDYGTCYIQYNGEWVYNGPSSSATIASVTYATGETTGIGSQLSSTAKVSLDGKTMKVNNAAVGSTVTLYDLSGKIIYSNVITVPNSERPIALSKGIYFVKVGNKTEKLLVK